MHDLGPAAREMARLVNGVRDDQLGDPTPCASYTLGDLVPADWRGETTAWLDRLARAWADPAAWTGTTWIAGFEAPSSAVGVTAANELVAHGWDVARASGQQLSLDDTALSPAQEFVAMMSGPGSDQARGDAFGPALPVPVGASALDAVVAGNGRDPAWLPR